MKIKLFNTRWDFVEEHETVWTVLTHPDVIFNAAGDCFREMGTSKIEKCGEEPEFYITYLQVIPYRITKD